MVPPSVRPRGRLAEPCQSQAVENGQALVAGERLAAFTFFYPTDADRVLEVTKKCCLGVYDPL